MWLSGLVTLFVTCVTFTFQLPLPELIYKDCLAVIHVNVSY